MAKARVEILKEVQHKAEDSEWVLCFQKCVYHYDNGRADDGFRFIWRKEDGKLQPARGQARIEDAQVMYYLIDEAVKAEWFPSRECK